MLSRESTKARVLMFFVLAIVIGPAMGEEEKEQNTGVLYSDDPTKGYNFFVPNNGIGSYIVDNDGNIAHSWTHPDGLPLGGYAYLTEDGTLLRAVRVPSAFFNRPPAVRGGSIMEFDKDGTCIWEFRYSSSLYRQLLDFLVLPNGNLLATATETHPWFDAVLKGFKGDIQSNPTGFWSDTLVEVPRKGRKNPEYDPYAQFKDGNFTNTCKTFSDELDLVWKWDVFDISFDYLKYSNWDINQQFTILSIDHFPGRDHILISCGGCGEVFIIDHAADDKKEYESEKGFIYRWGNPANYGAKGERKLSPGHADWVRDNYGWKFDKHGEGSILIFNNEDVDNEGQSSIVEITPPYKEGKYEKEKDGTFGPKDVNFKILDIYKKIKVKKEVKNYNYGGNYGSSYGGSYGGGYDGSYGGGYGGGYGGSYGGGYGGSYGGGYGGSYGGRGLYGGYGQDYGNYQTQYYYDYETEWTFFYSSRVGYAQPLPNGNVLLTASLNGQAIELEKLEKIVWEYINPVVNIDEIDMPKDPDTILEPFDEIPVCDEEDGDLCNRFLAVIKYSKDFKGFEKIFEK